MAFKNSSFLSLNYTNIALLILMSFFSSSIADIFPTANSLLPDSVCNATLYPKFCKSELPPNGLTNIHDYSRVSVRRSLSSALKFQALVDRYLAKRSTLSRSAIDALQVCQFLAELNVDYLQSTSNVLQAITNTLPTIKVEDLQTLLSAILTNHQTCLDCLQSTASAWSIRNGLSMPLSNGTKLYSVSLALFTRGWVRKLKRKGKLELSGRKLLFSDEDAGAIPSGHDLPLRMSSHDRKIFESVTGRKLLQTYEDVLPTIPNGIKVRNLVVVNPNGSGNFTTINDAVAAAPNNTDIGGGYFLIYIVSGVYEEYVSIAKNKKNLMMIGAGINQTVITGNRSVVDGWTTFNSATFAVVGERFVAVNITFQNTAGAIKHQAVAVRNGADLSTFYRCSFEGYQDTLYTHSMRQFYRECDIYGTVDFIFGNAAVVFQSCNLYARQPMQGQFNAITAQGRTDPNQNTGTSIHNCNIRAAPDLVSSNFSAKTYLGRPWKEYSRTVYMESFMDYLIEPVGWREWDGTFALNTLYYAEYNNAGPGSNTTGRVTWPGYHVIDATDAGNFTVSNFILGNDWLPATGVTYQSSLN